jgi:uncharacterized protein (UPF0335 family)
MTERFQNGERVATVETELAHIKEQVTDMAADITATRADVTEIKLALAKQDGERTAIKWIARAALAIAGVLATIFGYEHGLK